MTIERTIVLSGKVVPYTLRVSGRTGRMRLALYANGRFVVTVPRGMLERTFLQYLIAKSDWIVSKLEYFKKNPKKITPKLTRLQYATYKKQALVLVQTRLAFFNALYGFRFFAISIRNQKTRWGSCSKKGNLNFNYKITLLPPRLADYIIVHELCHLREMNHSKKFWLLVAKTIPNHKILRKELRQWSVK